MTWSVSRFRASDIVEVRTREEILATLDAGGCFEGMPFMPEMLRFCGRRFRVAAVAHKTCDTARKTGGRRLRAAVHLEGARCDGAAHGGCQAECNLFWKDVWLKPAGAGESSPPAARGCTESQLLDATRAPAPDGEPHYACQATRLPDATEPLPWWNLRQYLLDVTTRNHPLRRVLRVLGLASLRRLLGVVPFGYRLLKRGYDRAHRLLTGRPSPDVDGQVARGARTPSGRLDLQPGELVRVKSRAAIAATLDRDGKNRGLSFDPEMAPYCERVFTVRGRVTRLIDEATGRMLHLKEPCIVLEGVVCGAEYSACRLLCPRAIPSYWREIWLERVPGHRLDGPSEPRPPVGLGARRVELPVEG